MSLFAVVAQLVERLICVEDAACSIHADGSVPVLLAPALDKRARTRSPLRVEGISVQGALGTYGGSFKRLEYSARLTRDGSVREAELARQDEFGIECNARQLSTPAAIAGRNQPRWGVGVASILPWENDDTLSRPSPQCVVSSRSRDSRRDGTFARVAQWQSSDATSAMTDLRSGDSCSTQGAGSAPLAGDRVAPGILLTPASRGAFSDFPREQLGITRVRAPSPGELTELGASALAHRKRTSGRTSRRSHFFEALT